jgi:hypothetical protein
MRLMGKAQWTKRLGEIIAYFKVLSHLEQLREVAKTSNQTQDICIPASVTPF